MNPFRVNLTDCVFDLRTVAPTQEITIFGNNHNANWFIDCDITVSGGTILANTASSFVPVDINYSNTSSVIFDKDSSGEYTSLSVVSGTAYPAYTLIFQNARCWLNHFPSWRSQRRICSLAFSSFPHSLTCVSLPSSKSAISSL